METYFSVGEISKLTNVPIQTLRYYDKMGLLKPAYINEQNNYRYYSVNQFIKIDLLNFILIFFLTLRSSFLHWGGGGCFWFFFLVVFFFFCL